MVKQLIRKPGVNDPLRFHEPAERATETKSSGVVCNGAGPFAPTGLFGFFWRLIPGVTPGATLYRPPCGLVERPNSGVSHGFNSKTPHE